ncbi:MAG: hypothetical protein Kow00124_02370 [Anaerolineae bacterium]
MVISRRVQVIVLLTAVLIAVLLLGAGLSDLRLSPGEPVAVDQTPITAPPGLVPPRLQNNPLIWQVISLIMIILLPFSIIYAVLKPELRRRAISDAIVLTSVAVAYYLLMQRGTRVIDQLLERVEQSTEQLPAPRQTISPELFVSNPPDWLSYIVAGLVLILIALAAIYLWRLLRRRPAELDLLAVEALRAVDQIEAGANVRDVVLRCYYEMMRVMVETREIRREEAMTPREFEDRLKAAGLPQHDIERLTRLFESVRYGAQIPGEHEQQEAVSCLSAIVSASRGAS